MKEYSIRNTISKSTKPRQGVRYLGNGKEFDRNPRQWKQVVELWEAGKNKKGKTVYHSQTYHLPA